MKCCTYNVVQRKKSTSKLMQLKKKIITSHGVQFHQDGNIIIIVSFGLILSWYLAIKRPVGYWFCLFSRIGIPQTMEP